MNSVIYSNNWVERGTVIHSLGIMIAPKIFTVQKDIELSDGQIVKKGSQYFSWSVAHRLVEENKVPSGFRMLSPEEGKVLKDRYDRSGFGLLVLGLDGLIGPNDMHIYGISPHIGTKYIMRKGEFGYYWLDGFKNPVYPYVISVHGTQITADDYAYMSYGLPLILVKDL